jgi:5-methylthioadenosine/S-adenosylhomocysteine deaminase
MEDFDLLIRGSKVLQPDLTLLDEATIGVRGNSIARIETDASLAASFHAPEIVEGTGKVALPGLVDAHTHAAQQLLRGSVADELPMIWSRILVPFESNLTWEDVHTAARLFCIQNLKAGITCFADAGGPHPGAVIQAALETGIRAVVCRSTMDRGDFVPNGMKETTQDAVSRTEELHREYDGAGGGRVRVWFGIRQAMTSTPDLLETISWRSKALDTGVHAHLAEHLDEIAYCITQYGMRPAEWFDSFGLLGPSFLGAHSIRLADREVKLLRDRGANVVLCPRANLGSHGFAKTPLMMALGTNIALGTDGASSTRLDLFEQMRLLKFAMHARYGLEINDPLIMPTLDLLRMATAQGARALMLQDQIGTLAVGMKADIVLLKANELHISPTADLPKALVLTVCASDVWDVIVDGHLLLKDRAFVDLDEEAIRRQAGVALFSVAQRAGLRLSSPYTG